MKDQLSFLKFYFLTVGYRIFPVILLSIIASVVDVFGILLILPVILGNEENSLLNKFLPDSVFIGFISLDIFSKIIIIMILFLIKAVFLYSNTLFQSRVRLAIFKELQLKLVKHLETIPYQSYQKLRIPRLQELHLKHVANTCENLALFTQLLSNVVITFIVLYPIFELNPSILWGAVAFGMFGSFLFYAISIRVSLLSKKDVDLEVNLGNLITSFLRSFKYLIITGTVSKTAEQLQRSVKSVSTNKFKLISVAAISTFIREPLILIGLLCLYAIDVVLNGNGIDNFLIMLFLLYRAFSSLMTIGNSVIDISKSMGSFLELNEYLVSAKNLRDNKYSNLHSDPNKYALSTNELEFYYSDSEYFIQGDNIQIAYNSLTVIQGPSGSGKSTFINLITGLLKPTSGKVYLHGGDPLQLDNKKRQRTIGYVGQDTPLFESSLLENIVLWEEPDTNKVNAVLELVGLKEFANLSSLSEPVGLDGTRFSGGQKQRILIARELYRDSKILIFDEPTSALDKSTEQRIFSLLKKISRERTVIIVSHSTEAKLYADQILKVHRGYISAK